jgi:hypothetical protein
MDVYIGSNSFFGEEVIKNLSILKDKLDINFDLKNSNNLLRLINDSGETVYLENKEYNCLFDGYIVGCAGDELNSKIEEIAESLLNNIKIDFSNYNGIFNIVVQNKSKIIIYSDPSSLIPIYYTTIGGSFYYFSHVFIFASIFNIPPDYRGFAQKISMGYTLGSRTLFKDVSRLNPGEIVEYNFEKSEIISNYLECYFCEKELKKINLDKLFNSIDNSFKLFKNNHSEIGIMLSEGFDSRLLLGFTKRNSISLKTYSHVTEGTKGNKIIEKVVNLVNSDHYFNKLSEFPKDEKMLFTHLYLSDNINVPIWSFSTEYFKRFEKGLTLMAGTALDTTLGGHSFYLPIRPAFPAVKQRYFEILKQDIKIIKSSYVENLSELLINSFKDNNYSKSLSKISFFYNEDFINKIQNEFKGISDDVTNELNRIKKSGSRFNSQIIHRLFLENRVRKFSFGQELTLRINNKIYVPSYEYNFMKLISSVDPIYKLHHKLYYKFFSKYFNELFAIPNGGFGVSAKYPRLLTESLRFFHKKNEKKNFKKLLENKGKFPITKFRGAVVTDYLKRDEEELSKFIKLIDNKNIKIDSFKQYLNDKASFKSRTFLFEEIYLAFELKNIFDNYEDPSNN